MEARIGIYFGGDILWLPKVKKYACKQMVGFELIYWYYVLVMITNINRQHLVLHFIVN